MKDMVNLRAACSAALLVAFGLFGCRGTLKVQEPGAVPTTCEDSADCGLGQICVDEACAPSAGACAADLPEGDCPQGRLCQQGHCLCASSDGCGCPAGGCATEPPCQCSGGQVCDGGACVEPGPAATCSGTNLDGACPGGEVCVGGSCVPREPGVNDCSSDRPDGLCPPGSTCREGRCVPIGDCACSEDPNHDCCPAGLQCEVSGGGPSCVVAACSTTAPFGTCPADQRCIGGVCEDLPCSPGHPDGACDAGQFCSSTGACIAEGTCAANQDCPTLTYCSGAGTCLNLGDCTGDDDCAAQDAFGQGYACTAGSCLERTTCALDGDCAPPKTCGELGNCIPPGACEGPSDCVAGEVCSATGTCIPEDACSTNADCSPGERCASNQTCLPVGTCINVSDCPPGHGCSDGACQVVGDLCTSNDFTAVGCTGDVLYCCATGTAGDCCAHNQRCSTAGSCIPEGSCVDDGDCLAGFATCGDDYQCKGHTPCGGPADCGADERCSSGGYCVPDDRCAHDFDCPIGEHCNAQWTCVPGGSRPVPQCGFDSLAIGNLVAPNVLIVLDHSASMQLCGEGDPLAGHCGQPGDAPTCDTGSGGASVTRWDEAVSVLDLVTQEYEDSVNFGLSIYPHPTGAEVCSTPCNWPSCNDNLTLAAGEIDVPVGAGTRGDIVVRLQATAPGGATPTAPTLREIVRDPAAAGLAAEDRENAILLVTDGVAIGDLADVQVCEPPCADGLQNGNETGIDCGGSCPRCPVGGGCLSAEDCESGVCRAGECRDASCDDGVQAAPETALDCGGRCGPCGDGQACAGPADCASGQCMNEVCQPPSCVDGILNGTETAVDCGGPCTPCGLQLACNVDEDCLSAVCQRGACRPGTCANGTLDGDETATDCGGSCGPCLDGEACAGDDDCAGGVCAGTCTTPECADGVKNGDETGVDCGGSCPPCPGGGDCLGDGDCLSGVCRICPPGDDACRVYAALDQLVGLSPRVKTFVVGFAFSTVSRELNCYTAHGRTARRDNCPDLEPEGCADETATCYYEASDAVSLSSALGAIIGQVSSCTYSLATPPPNPAVMFMYLDRDPGPDLDLQAVPRFTGWQYDPLLNRVSFLGSACAELRAGTAAPLLLYGCPIDG